LCAGLAFKAGATALDFNLDRLGLALAVDCFAERALAWTFLRVAPLALDFDFLDFAISLFPPVMCRVKKAANYTFV